MELEAKGLKKLVEPIVAECVKTLTLYAAKRGQRIISKLILRTTLNAAGNSGWLSIYWTVYWKKGVISRKNMIADVSINKPALKWEIGYGVLDEDYAWSMFKVLREILIPKVKEIIERKGEECEIIEDKNYTNSLKCAEVTGLPMK